MFPTVWQNSLWPNDYTVLINLKLRQLNNIANFSFNYYCVCISYCVCVLPAKSNMHTLLNLSVLLVIFGV